MFLTHSCAHYVYVYMQNVQVFSTFWKADWHILKKTNFSILYQAADFIRHPKCTIHFSHHQLLFVRSNYRLYILYIIYKMCSFCHFVKAGRQKLENVNFSILYQDSFFIYLHHAYVPKFKGHQRYLKIGTFRMIDDICLLV